MFLIIINNQKTRETAVALNQLRVVGRREGRREKGEVVGRRIGEERDEKS